MEKTIQGIAVPALGFGTWRIWGDECRRAVADALAIGYRHIDTAQMYENEAEVGRAIAESDVAREDIFLTTKLLVTNLEPRRARETSEKSLRRLGVDYVDLLLIHWPSEEVELEATLDVMLALQQEGKVRQLGVSNFPVALMRRAMEHAPIFCNQVEYHPYLGQRPLLDACRKHDILLTAYRPLGKGAVLDDETLLEIADRHRKSSAQVALRWLIQKPQVATIPKAASAENRRANFDIFDFELTPDEMRAIDRLDRRERLTNPSFAPQWDQA